MYYNKEYNEERERGYWHIRRKLLHCNYFKLNKYFLRRLRDIKFRKLKEMTKVWRGNIYGNKNNTMHCGWVESSSAESCQLVYWTRQETVKKYKQSEIVQLLEKWNELNVWAKNVESTHPRHYCMHISIMLLKKLLLGTEGDNILKTLTIPN